MEQVSERVIFKHKLGDWLAQDAGFHAWVNSAQLSSPSQAGLDQDLRLDPVFYLLGYARYLKRSEKEPVTQ